MYVRTYVLVRAEEEFLSLSVRVQSLALTCQKGEACRKLKIVIIGSSFFIAVVQIFCQTFLLVPLHIRVRT